VLVPLAAGAPSSSSKLYLARAAVPHARADARTILARSYDDRLFFAGEATHYDDLALT